MVHTFSFDTQVIFNQHIARISTQMLKAKRESLQLVVALK